MTSIFSVSAIVKLEICFHEKKNQQKKPDSLSWKRFMPRQTYGMLEGILEFPYYL